MRHDDHPNLRRRFILLLLRLAIIAMVVYAFYGIARGVAAALHGGFV